MIPAIGTAISANSCARLDKPRQFSRQSCPSPLPTGVRFEGNAFRAPFPLLMQEVRNDIDDQRENCGIIAERNHRVSERKATNTWIRDLYVRDLKRHTEHEREVR